MNRPSLSSLLQAPWILKSNDYQSLRFITIATVVVRYAVFVAAIALEYHFCVTHQAEIAERLTHHGLCVDKHRKCVETYLCGVLVGLGLMGVELLSVFLGEWLNVPEPSALYLIGVVCILVIEYTITLISEQLDIKPIGSLSNFLDVLGLSPSQNLVMTSMGLFLSMFLSHQSLDSQFLVSLLVVSPVFVVIQRQFLLETGSLDARLRNMNTVFDDWSPLSGRFSTAVTALLKKVEFPKEQCVAIYSRRKYIIGEDDVIMIPSEVLTSYKDDALVGYIAFVLGELHYRILPILMGLTVATQVLSGLVFIRLFLRFKTGKNVVSATFKAIKVARMSTFFLSVGASFITRALEMRCDQFVVNLGYKAELMSYIKAIDGDPDVEYSSIFMWYMELLSPRNSLVRRLTQIDKMGS